MRNQKTFSSKKVFRKNKGNGIVGLLVLVGLLVSFAIQLGVPHFMGWALALNGLVTLYLASYAQNSVEMRLKSRNSKSLLGESARETAAGAAGVMVAILIMIAMFFLTNLPYVLMWGWQAR